MWTSSISTESDLGEVGKDPVVGGERGRGEADEGAGQEVDRSSSHLVQHEGEADSQEGPVHTLYTLYFLYTLRRDL